MRFSAPGGGIHPLLPVMFIAAGLLNLAIGTLPQLDVSETNSVQSAAEWLPSVLLHIAFYARVFTAVRFASGQRARDLREFERLAKELGQAATIDPKN
jgi:hypothetical protein